ncbi:glycoprotease family domain-containing protein [Ditylenchus destructor]|uniref:N(6)-L-threonylcarbamoyladenine synthase n=1 Tax=Ditylenchus destructor TaxID=166010 RepID=A0AAD4MT93_9BILA|nr:glycoprotease family domain-containing protein [Ditylenchus destructor]
MVNFINLSKRIILRRMLSYSSRKNNGRPLKVLGIETSCDDTAVCILDSERRVLAARKYAERECTKRLGGILPSLAAIQHRDHIDRLVVECAEEANLRLSDLDAISVSSRPGLVICLKVGADKAVALAREYRLKLIPAHHMRAHAIVCRLHRPDITYPFVSLLISGGHSLIVVCRDVDRFEIIGHAETGQPSAGGCLDKLARTIGLEPKGTHYAAALEDMSRNASPEGYKRYPVMVPRGENADFNFQMILNKYKYIIHTTDLYAENNLADLCASIQFSVMTHICTKLAYVFKYLLHADENMREAVKKTLVVAGGVASNSYLMGCIGVMAKRFGFETYAPPPSLCTDNAEMVAWLGMELLLRRKPCADIYEYNSLPDQIYVLARSDIGEDMRHTLLNHVVEPVRAHSIHEEHTGRARKKLV